MRLGWFAAPLSTSDEALRLINTGTVAFCLHCSGTAVCSAAERGIGDGLHRYSQSRTQVRARTDRSSVGSRGLLLTE